METKTMGQIIADRRKELGLTQKDLAEKMNITDKAVSKWERDLSCPDVSSIPKLAEVLGLSVEELMTNAQKPEAEANSGELVDTILKAIPLAMGVAVAALSVLGKLDMNSGFGMLGIGLACLSIRQFRK